MGEVIVYLFFMALFALIQLALFMAINIFDIWEKPSYPIFFGATAAMGVVNFTILGLLFLFAILGIDF
jgi:hypothetical protein